MPLARRALRALLPAFLLALPASPAMAAPAAPPRPVLSVAAASSVQFALEEIRQAFARARGAEVRAVYGATGHLAAQARAGAPFHVLVSADMAYPDSLIRAGLAEGPVRPYAYGLLVLWTTRADLDPARGLALLAGAEVRRVAIPDPALAPFGREALFALARAGLLAAVRPKLAYAQNVGQAGQHVLTGAADIGFSAKSVVMSVPLRGKGRWAGLDSAAYRPIPQGAALLARGRAEHPDLARAFLDFLHGAPARAVLAAHGYRLPSEGGAP